MLKNHATTVERWLQGGYTASGDRLALAFS